MAAGFVRKWFGRSPPADPEVKVALGELADLAQARPTLAGPIALLGDLLPGLFEGPIEDVPLSLIEEYAASKLAGGVPLLRGENLRLEGRGFRRRWLRVCQAVERHQDAEAGKRLALTLRQGHLDGRELMGNLLAGRPETIYARAEALDLEAALVATVLRLTLLPMLSQVNTGLTKLRQTRPWEHGYCPTCGSWPLLGEFRGLEQIRYLRCGLCAAEWPFPRLRCPYCGTRDHHQLGYLHVEGEENKYRAATCDACRGYVKMLSTLAALSAPRLLAAELATTHLDLAAADRGYAIQTDPPEMLSV
jgi:FdhE protein